MSNKKHTQDLVDQQVAADKKLELLREDHDYMSSKLNRYESLKLIRTGAKRKEMINYLNKYGIGLDN